MRKWVVLCGLVLCGAGWFLGAQTGPGPVVVPENFLRGYDPVTVFYPSDVGPKGGGPADGPGPWLEIQPAPPGEYRWMDARTMQFLPAVPWPALREYRVKAKTTVVTLSTMMVPPSGLNPQAGSRNLEPVSTLVVVFPAPLDVATLKEMVRFRVFDLPGLESSPSRTLDPGSYSLRELEASRKEDSSTFRFAFRDPVPYGKKLVMDIRLSKDPSIPDSVASFSFETKPEFRITGLGSGSTRLPVNANGARYDQDQAMDCGTGREPLWVEFTESLSEVDLETLKRMVRFEPAVRNLTWRTAGNRIYLQFDADRDLPYRLQLDWQGIKSSSGRVLSPFGQSSAWFWYRQSTPYLDWRLSQGITERYGPQMIPMEGRGMERIDLRIHSIDPESPDFFPFPDRPVAIDEDSRPPMPGEEPRHGHDLSGWIRLLPSPEVSRMVTLPLDSTSPRTRFGLDLKDIIAGTWGKEKPGTYLVGYRLPGASSQRQFVRISVTDLCLSTVEEEDGIVFAVTSFRTGKPVEGVDVRLDARETRDGDVVYTPVLRGRTDSRGMYRYRHLTPLEDSPKRLVLALGDDRLVTSLDSPPPGFSNNHWSGGSRSWLSWLTSKPRQEQHRASTLAWMFCERPVYRPEEKVHVAGWVRDRKDGLLGKARLDDALEVCIRVDDKEWIKPVTLEDEDRFSFDFDESGEITGRFSADLRFVKSRNVLDRITFKKEAYRVPRFELNMLGPDRVPVDQPFRLTLVADYYAGGRVTGQNVLWEQTAYPYSIRAPRWDGFVFSSDERFQTGGGSFDGDAMNSTMVLDSNGSAVLEINPALDGEGRPRRYVVEATVEGADSQTVTTIRQVVALPPVNLGLKLERQQKDSGGIRPSLLVLDHVLEPKAGVDVEVRLIQRQWHSFITRTDISTGEAKYVSDTVDKVILEKTVTSGNDALELPLAVPEPGVYLVDLSVRDRLGRRMSVRSDTFVPGDKAQSWERKTDGLFEIQPDKASYRPGDTASLLFKSPWQDARALVVVENPSGNRYDWVEIRNGVGTYALPVTPNMIPQVPVSVLLMRGRVEGSSPRPGTLVDLGRPATLGSSLMVNVRPESNQAILTLNHEAKQTPGATMTMDLDLKDPDGKPLDGHVALWLVDRAVLSLGTEQALDPLSRFITPAWTGLRMNDMRNLVLGVVPMEEIPGGDGEEAMMSRMEMLNKTTVRKNFQTVPYFRAGIPVKNGKARITIDLPDNLTDFAVRGIAASGYDRFGVGRSVVSIRLPVIIQSAFPRFLRPGDTFRAGATARVVEGQGGPGRTIAKVKGLEIDQDSPEAKKGELKQGPDGTVEGIIKLPASDALRVDLPWRVPEPDSPDGDGQAEITMYVQRDSDKARDAYAMAVPVKSESARETVASLEEKTGAVSLDFPIPEGRTRKGSVEQTLMITRDLRLIRMVQAWEYLDAYSYGCLEQRISRLAPRITLKDLVNRTGMQFPVVDKAVMDEFTTYLRSCQDEEGLYGFWPGSTSYVFLTAYALEFLASAKNAGIAFDETGVDRAVQALRRSLRSDYGRLLSSWSDYERIEAMTALEAWNVWDLSYAVQLLDKGSRLPLYSQARLASLAAKRNLRDDPRTKALMKNLEGAVISRKEGNRIIFAGLSEGDRYFGGAVLYSSLRTMTALLDALSANRGNPSTMSLLAEGILSQAGNDGWGSTIDNTSALGAMKHLLAQPVADSPDTTVKVTQDGKSQVLSLRPGIVAWTGRGSGRVKVEGFTGRRPMTFLLRTSWLPAGSGKDHPAVTRGLVVERESLRIDREGHIATRMKSDAGALELPRGAVVEDHVRLVNPQDARYVAIVVPLAAGMEPLNPELATSPPEAKPLGSLTLKPSYVQYLDDRACFYYDELPKGTYDFWFRTRSSFEGTFAQPPARAEMMYKLSVRGTSSGQEVRITP